MGLLGVWHGTYVTARSASEYIDADFENIRIMIFKNYDSILKTTFGNYMELPPLEKRVSHGLEAYWKEKQDNE